MKKKSDAAYTWVQDETAEIANTGYRLKTIYQQNKTVPRKYLTRKLEFSFSGSLYLEKERGGEKRNEGEHSQGACVLVSQKKIKTKQKRHQQQCLTPRSATSTRPGPARAR